MPQVQVMAACPTDDVLGALVQRTLEDAEAREVTSHLDTCNACRQVVIAAVRGGVGRAAAAGHVDTPPTIALGTPTLDPVRRAEGSSPDIAIGARVGRYELRELLGSGGMGRVYAAYDGELDRSIALKVMRPDLARRANVLTERLVRESQLMAKIVHPSVIAVHDVGRVGNAVFIAMDLVRGETLGAYVRRAAPGWRETLALLVRAGEGLAAAHARGVVHRDFKPDNVLVELDEGKRAGRVVVTDFGVARAFAEPESSRPPSEAGADEAAVGPVVIDLRLTATGTAVGTPAYMAPEHLGGGGADQRADVWAFAVTAWELLFGERPFPGRSVDELRKALAERPRAPGTEVPARIVRALEKGLAFDAAQRWPDMTSFLAALDVAEPPRRSRAVIVAAAAGATAIACAGAIAGARWSSAGTSDDPAPSSKAAMDPCAVARAAFDDAYDTARTSALSTALAQDPALRDLVNGKLAVVATKWRKAMDDACRPQPTVETHGTGEVASATEKLACLEARRIELAGFIDDVIADGPAHAKKLSAIVGDPAFCTDPKPGMVEARVPADPALRRKVTALRYRGFDTEDVRDRGDHQAAVAAATAIVGDARTLWPPAHAEALYLLGTTQALGGDTVAGNKTLRDCAALAERVHHDYIAANAWIALAQGAAFDAGDPTRAVEYLAYADAAVSRIAARDDILSMLEYVRGTTLIESDRAAEGEAALRRALEIAERGAPEMVSLVTQGLGYLAEDRGRYEEAVAAYRKALAQLPAGKSPGTEVIYRDRLAICLGQLGRADEAVREARLALSLAEKYLGEAHLDRAVARVNLAQVLLDANKPEEALAEAERGTRHIAKILGERAERYGEALALEGAILVELDRFEEAERRFSRACDIIAFDTGDNSSQQAECWIHETAALMGLKRWQPALQLTERALTALVKAFGEGHPQVANAYVVRGVVHHELGQRDKALADLGKARTLFADATIDPGHLAAAEWGYGKILGPGDARARPLVRQAVARFAKAGPTWQATRKDAEAWLAAHP